MATIKIIVEKHADGYVAYPLGLNGTVVGRLELRVPVVVQDFTRAADGLPAV